MTASWTIFLEDLFARALAYLGLTSDDVYGARNQGFAKLRACVSWRHLGYPGYAHCTVNSRQNIVWSTVIRTIKGVEVKMVILRSSGNVGAETAVTTPRRRTMDLDSSSEFVSLLPAPQRKSSRLTRSSRILNDSANSPEHDFSIVSMYSDKRLIHF